MSLRSLFMCCVCGGYPNVLCVALCVGFFVDVALLTVMFLECLALQALLCLAVLNTLTAGCLYSVLLLLPQP